MEWRPVITPAALKTSYTLFSKLRSEFHARVVAMILEKIGTFLGYPVGVVISTDVAELVGDAASLRALRLLNQLRDGGIVRSYGPDTHPYGDEPQGYVTMVALNGVERLGFAGKGADMLDRTNTLWPAVGEAVERYATEFHYPLRREYVDSSWNELTGPKADIFGIAGFDESLRERGHRDFALKYDADTKFRWVKARTLPDRKEVWAPLQWFSFAHIQRNVYTPANRASEPLLTTPVTTGAAAGQTVTHAILHGLLEVIERDAFIIYWLHQIPAKRIELATLNDPRIDSLVAIAERYRLEVHALYLETDIPVHTVGCLIVDRSGVGPAILAGAKTSLDLRDAVYGVLSDMLAQRGLYRKMMSRNEYGPAAFADINRIGHLERIHYWFSSERLPFIERFVSGPPVGIDDLPMHAYANDVGRNLEKLLTVFADKGYAVMYRELHDTRLRELADDLSVVMVRVPRMQPLHLDESLRCLGGDRLSHVPAFLGIASPTIPTVYSTIPHPFP